MAAKRSAYPVHTLREHVTALEAAITATLADPDKEAVHRLRTSSCRIEAQIKVISLLPEIPDIVKGARKACKLLRKLRGSAGAVRDLDVQRDLIQEYVGAQTSGVPRQKASSAQKLRTEKLLQDAHDLRRKLKDQRSERAEELVELLREKESRIVPALEGLLDSLSEFDNVTLTTTSLARLTLSWYRSHTAAIPSDGDPENLHAVRKAAKLARYIAESGAEQLARRFEALQEAGGTLHDLLTLAAKARKYLGARSPLTRAFTEECESALEIYREALRRQPTET